MRAEVQPAQPSDLTVHEWGTFTSVAGEDGSAVEWDALGGKDDLPRFVNDFGYRCFKSEDHRHRADGNAGDVLLQSARIGGACKGRISSRAYHRMVSPGPIRGLSKERIRRLDVRRLEANLNGIDTSLTILTGAIEWPSIKVEPNTSPALPTETGPSRYYAARGTDSAPLAVGDEHEKFLFYRGVGRFPVPLSARVTGNGTIAVENRGAEPVPTVILFENHGGHLGYRNAGAVKDAVTLDSPSLDGSLPGFARRTGERIGRAGSVSEGGSGDGRDLARFVV